MSRGRRVDATGRSKTCGQFVKLSYHLLRSPAFRTLNGSAKSLFLELRTRFNGHNNGSLSVSLQEAADLLHMSKSTAKRAFEELEEKGFIRLKRRGQWYGRLASEWILTDESYNNQPATRDWQNWTAPDPGQT